MGNCIISAYWNPKANDWRIINELKDIARDYGLTFNVDPNNPDWIPGKSTFSGEISGCWISWYGGPKECQRILEKVKRDWEQILAHFSAEEGEIRILYLPM